MKRHKQMLQFIQHIIQYHEQVNHHKQTDLHLVIIFHHEAYICTFQYFNLPNILLLYYMPYNISKDSFTIQKSYKIKLQRTTLCHEGKLFAIWKTNKYNSYWKD